MAHAPYNPRHLPVEIFASEGAELDIQTPLAAFDRLCESIQGDADGLVVQWHVQGELRTQRYGAQPQVWLHLQAQATVPMTCQRCMMQAPILLEVDQSFRFVANERQAEEEDEDSDEDILVLSRDFDVQALVEDELIMALPPIPKHDKCPQTPRFEAVDAAFSEEAASKPNPFAVLQQLKPKDGA